MCLHFLLVFKCLLLRKHRLYAQYIHKLAQPCTWYEWQFLLQQLKSAWEEYDHGHEGHLRGCRFELYRLPKKEMTNQVSYPCEVIFFNHFSSIQSTNSCWFAITSCWLQNNVSLGSQTKLFMIGSCARSLAEYVRITYVNSRLLRWCLFFWVFAESNLFLEFRLFVFLFFYNLL